MNHKIACMLFIAGYALSAHAKDQAPAYVEIQSKFPNSVKVVTEPEGYFEFCPDNTCDLLKAKKPISADVLLDIGYLYVYYFSDYFELEEWRKRKQASVIARAILSKPDYAACGNAKQKKQARCVLQSVMKDSDVTLYFVRYDEKERHLKRVNLPK